jgi:hypothetical protein
MQYKPKSIGALHIALGGLKTHDRHAGMDCRSLGHKAWERPKAKHIRT